MTLPAGIDLTTDWHSHLLPGLDDGPATLAESLAMARYLAGAGVRTVHCTPHAIRGSYDTTPDIVRAATADLQQALTRAGIDLKLRPGIEYLLDEFFPVQLDNPLPLGDSDLLLVESYSTLPLSHLKEYLFAIVRAGFRPLLAHPERNARFAPPELRSGLLARLRRPPSDETPSDILAELQDMGCLFQGNLGSLTGYYGRQVQSAARTIHDRGLYHVFGSDVHSLAHCRAMLGQARESAF